MVDEVKESIENNLKEKFSSPFYGALIISWCLWNWKIWYVTLFVDSQLLLQEDHFLKIDYIGNLYSWDLWWNFVCSFSHLFFLPILSAFIIVFLLPKITCKFYEKSLQTENINKLAKVKKEKEFLMAKGDKLTVEKDVLEKERKIREIELEKPITEVWSKEYENFINSRYFQQFDALRSSIYNHEGMTKTYAGVIIPSDFKAFIDVNGIAEITKDKNLNEIVKLTEKGRYFMKRYTGKN